MSDKWNTTTVDPSQAPEPLSELVLNENLGHTSQFVGLMDTEDKVRGHLDAVAQYQTVYRNLLNSDQFTPEERKRAYCSEWVACDACESPHGACVDVCAKAGRAGTSPALSTGGFFGDGKCANCQDPHGVCANGCQFPYSVEQQADAQHPAPSPDCPEEGCPHYGTPHSHPAPYNPAPAQVGYVPAQQPWEGTLPQPATAEQIEAARVAWRGAIAKRDELMAQWNAYIKQLSDEFKRLRGQ